MVNKKIRDIFPPKEKNFHSQKEIIKPRIEPNSSSLKLRLAPPHFKKNKFLAFFLIVFFIFAIFCFFRLPKAEIEIWPETETFELESKINLDGSVLSVFKKEKILKETFQSTGKISKEEKAEGMVIVYNEYSESSQILIASTRFVSSDGKVFRTLERVTIPGREYEKGKLIPGEIEIKIVADEPGPEYNINPTTFSIPGFAGTDRYLKFYAKSFEPMKGGFKEEITKIIENDLREAEEILVQNAKKQCREVLKKEIEEKEEYYSFLDNIEVEINEKLSSANVEEEKKEFDFEVRVTCQTLVFEKKYFENYIQRVVKEKFDENKKIVENSLEVNYFSEEFDLTSVRANISSNFFLKIYSEINQNSLKNALVGKSLNETETFLGGQSNILKTNIKLWPFWVRKIPQNLERINLFLKFD